MNLVQPLDGNLETVRAMCLNNLSQTKSELDLTKTNVSLSVVYHYHDANL